MAGDDHYNHGQMEIREQRGTYHAFLGMSKWGSLALAVLVLSATMWFCTDGGFFPGFVAGLVVLIVGILLLREKKAPAAH